MIRFADGTSVPATPQNFKLNADFETAATLTAKPVTGTQSLDGGASVYLHAAKSIEEQLRTAEALPSSASKDAYIARLRVELDNSSRHAPPSAPLALDDGPRHGITSADGNYIQHVGLPNAGNTCFLNSTLQVLAALRVLHAATAGETTDPIYQLSQDHSAPALVRVLCEQLVAMRYPQDSTRRGDEPTRLRYLSALFAAKFNMAHGSEHDAAEVLHVVLSEATMYRPQLKQILDFGMIRVNTKTNVASTDEPYSAVTLYMDPYLRETRPRRAIDHPEMTDIEFALLNAYPDRGELVEGVTCYTFPMLFGSRFNALFPMYRSFGNTRLMMFTLNWTRWDRANQVQTYVEPSELAGAPLTIPLMLGHRTRLQVDVSAEHEPTRIEECEMSSPGKHRDYVLRAFIVNQPGHYVSYVRNYGRWWRASDSSIRDITSELDLANGKLALNDRQIGRVSGLYYEMYQSNCTEGYYRHGSFIERIGDVL